MSNDSCSSAIDAGKEYGQIQPRYSQFASHFTNTRKDIARSQTQSVQNQQHSKTLNPKFSALIDSIVDEEPSSKDKPTTSPESLTTPPAPKKKTLSINKLFSVKKTPPRVDLSAKVDDDDDITDTDDDDDIDNLPPPKQDEGQTDLTAMDVDDDSDDSDNESYSGIEPVDMTFKDDKDEEDEDDDDDDDDDDEDDDLSDSGIDDDDEQEKKS